MADSTRTFSTETYSAIVFQLTVAIKVTINIFLRIFCGFNNSKCSAFNKFTLCRVKKLIIQGVFENVFFINRDKKANELEFLLFKIVINMMKQIFVNDKI